MSPSCSAMSCAQSAPLIRGLLYSLSKQLLLYGQRVAHTVSHSVGLLSGGSIEIAGCDMKDRNGAVLLCSSIDPSICPSIYLSCHLYERALLCTRSSPGCSISAVVLAFSNMDYTHCLSSSVHHSTATVKALL
jgi:hypothetical protein